MLRKSTVALAVAQLLGGTFVATDAFAARGGGHGGGGHAGHGGGGHAGHGGGHGSWRSRIWRRIWRRIRWLLRSGLRVWRLPSVAGAHCWLLVKLAARGSMNLNGRAFAAGLVD